MNRLLDARGKIKGVRLLGKGNVSTQSYAVFFYLDVYRETCVFPPLSVELSLLFLPIQAVSQPLSGDTGCTPSFSWEEIQNPHGITISCLLAHSSPMSHAQHAWAFSFYPARPQHAAPALPNEAATLQTTADLDVFILPRK